MANNPVMGMVTCPYCKAKIPVVWNGNFKFRCIYCHKDFRIKRQKLKNVQPIHVKKND